MIKVLEINTVAFHINGMSNVIMGLYENIRDKDIRFDFVVKDHIDESYADVIRKNGDKIFVVERKIKTFPKYINRLAKIIRKGNYDIIHIHGNSSTMSLELMAAKKSGTKAKFIVHAHNIACDHPIVNKILYPYLMRTADYKIACSRAAGEWLYGKRRYMVLNNGIDEEKFRFNPEMRKEHRKELGIDDKFVILHVGRYNPQKNHVFLINVFEEISKREPNAVLRLLGDGFLIEDIKALVKEKNLEDKIFFVPPTKTPEIEYNAADLFILPSLFEGFGLVNVEAQCSGLPCVVSDPVPHDIAVTDAIDFIPLDAPLSVWADAVLKYKGFERRDNRSNVIKSGYSAACGARKLKNFMKKAATKK